MGSSLGGLATFDWIDHNVHDVTVVVVVLIRFMEQRSGCACICMQSYFEWASFIPFGLMSDCAGCKLDTQKYYFTAQRGNNKLSA